MNFYYLNKRTNLIIICLMMLLTTGCFNETLENEPTIEESFSSSNGNTQPNKYIQPNQLVVKYNNPNISDTDKANRRADLQEQFKFQIVSYETCNCDIKDIELWTINMSTAGFTKIEDLISNIQQNDGTGDMDGNPQFHFSIMKAPDAEATLRNLTIHDRVVDSNNPDAVNIAIIDTGIDYNYLPQSVLYNSGNDPTCDNEISGWDFVNDNNDPFDDHYHGTLVASLIRQNLDRVEVPYHFISLKAFDHSGIGSYFNAVCAVSYILKHGNIQLANMSFGWNNVHNTTILQNLIGDLEGTTLFIGSAGNDGDDTDIQGNEHYPSGYNVPNFISVAGYEQNPNGVNLHVDNFGRIFGDMIASGSNFGTESIDLAAPFTYDMNIEARNLLVRGSGYVNGTSYSAAFTTYRAAELLHRRSVITPSNLKGATINSGFFSTGIRDMVRQNRSLTGQINILGTTNAPIHPERTISGSGLTPQ